MTELEETKQYRLSARKNASLLSVDKNQDLLNNVLYSNEYYNTVALSFNKQTRGYKLFHKNEIYNFPNNKQLHNYLEKLKEKMRQHRQDNPEQFKQYQKEQEKHSRDTRKEQINEQANKMHVCDICKSIYTHKHKSRHEATNKHIKMIKA